ncbi:MAG: deoxyribonuclease IV [Verrucomicrobia bacterium]|nr:deoxyribonuclease IV [Verrucomicrobiota bacterium]MBS0636889.1 deoxyribonuclease IV [Verrucomicrobiota bacterium]
MQKEILLGAHTSAAGGVQNALYEGKEIGATTIQLFTSNQRQWNARTLSEETVDKWKQALDETGIKEVMSHDSYLINLGAPDPEVLAKSRHAFREELLRSLQLGLSYVNFHPGSALQGGVTPCLDKIVESLKGVKDLFTGKEKLKLLLETTAGQGSVVGAKFEELAYVIERVKDDVPVGVCIDTCHIFVAGYDIRTKEALDSTLSEFDRIVGLKYLNAFHLNDSKKGLGSRVDRHEDLGKGTIGMECFKAIMQDPRLKHLPKYLETPGGKETWKKEIIELRSFVK